MRDPVPTPYVTPTLQKAALLPVFPGCSSDYKALRVSVLLGITPAQLANLLDRFKTALSLSSPPRLFRESSTQNVVSAVRVRCVYGFQDC